VSQDGSSGNYNFGSGYIVADGVVLTAAHVLSRAKEQPARVGDPCEVMAWQGADWRWGQVVWLSADLDVAAVSCDGCAAEESVKWGYPTGSDPLSWKATGFPRASIEGEGRKPEEAFGTFALLSGGPTDLCLTITSRQANPSENGASGWAGLSGAAIFSDDYLIGIMVTDPATYTGSLVGRRASSFVMEQGLVDVLKYVPLMLEIRRSEGRVGALATDVLDSLVRRTLEAICRVVSLPKSPSEAKVRAFVFKVEGPELVCRYHWALNPTSESVGITRFPLTDEASQEVIVVQSVKRGEIVRTDVGQLAPKISEVSTTTVDPRLMFVLAAPIRTPEGEVWGTVDFDAATEFGKKRLLGDDADAAIFQLTQLLQALFSLLQAEPAV
jgi:hypothetical protein